MDIKTLPKMNIRHFFLLFVAAISISCVNNDSPKASDKEAVKVESVLPVSGTFLNLVYQDVRNKYTNPPAVDYTDPLLWHAKVDEMKKMGMEYLVLMAVANEGKSFYPSSIMQSAYDCSRQSPVDAIMEAAERNGMHVFMSTGWAKDQDDNLRDPAIKQRQIQIMMELAGIYGDHPAMYGWYLPVEDCFGPVLTDYAVDAVNALTAKARALTPGKKILISPYGIFNSDFSDPRYEQQILRLEVDIIAYQDEIGCVRERYPLPRLRENWKKLRAIHDKTDIEMWANCESFAWEAATNDRTSALIPAPFGRFLGQLAAATEGGAERIISFMMYGIFEDPESPYQLGQPYWSNVAYEEYMAWRNGDRRWKTAEAAFLGHYGRLGQEDMNWDIRKPGEHELTVELAADEVPESLLVRMLVCHKDEVKAPDMLALSVSPDGKAYRLLQIKSCPVFPNTRHDAFVDCVLFEDLDKCIPEDTRFIRISYSAPHKTALDRLILNP